MRRSLHAAAPLVRLADLDPQLYNNGRLFALEAVPEQTEPKVVVVALP